MWWRGWSGANPSVVSPWGRGCSARGMGVRCSRGGTHSSTALSGSRAAAAGAVARGAAVAGAAGLERLQGEGRNGASGARKRFLRWSSLC